MNNYLINEYELLEIFESFPEITDSELGRYTYQRQDEYGFILEMNLVICESSCILALFHKDLKSPIFEISCIYNVEKIICKKDRMIIQRDDQEDIIVDFKPGYSIKFEKRS